MITDRLDYEEALRRLALNDKRFVASILALRPSTSETADGMRAEEAMLQAVEALDGRTRRLVDLAALIAVGSGEASIDSAVEGAILAGATVEDVIGVLFSIAPTVGAARVVGCAPHIAAAVGYDMWADLEGFGTPPAGVTETPAAVASQGASAHRRDR